MTYFLGNVEGLDFIIITLIRYIWKLVCECEIKKQRSFKRKNIYFLCCSLSL